MLIVKQQTVYFTFVKKHSQSTKPKRLHFFDNLTVDSRLSLMMMNLNVTILKLIIKMRMKEMLEV